MKSLLFVDDEQNVLLGLERMLRPMRHEWNMTFVKNGADALEFMATQPVDIIVTDMMMTGMDGTQLLYEVARLYPQTVRIILSGHGEREAILQLVGPAHQYLAKPCNADELRNAVTRAFTLRDLLNNAQLKQLTSRIKSLPNLPTLQNQVTEELFKDSPSIERIGELISHDIAMTTKVLQLVNSAFFGLSQPIHDPTEAVVYLGLCTIRALTLSVGIFAQFDEKTCDGFSIDALAKHSWLVGDMARRIAHQEHQEIKILEQCFLAGLLHDIGQLILVTGLPQEYAAVITKANKEKLPVWIVEQEFFGATHADVGAYLLALWGLPNPIIEAVAMHHHPERCAASGIWPTVAVHVADVFAHEAQKTNTEGPPPQIFTKQMANLDLADRIESWRTNCLQTNEP